MVLIQTLISLNLSSSVRRQNRLSVIVCPHAASMDPSCPHDCKCKMGIWMAEKRELVFVKQQALARHSPEGGRMPNLRATISLKCLFLMSGERGPFSSTKETDPLRFPRPLLLILQTAHLCC